MKYRIYIDEVGNPDLGSSDNPNHRFLSLTGIILELSYVETAVYPLMEEFKRKHFYSHPDEPVIFHRKEVLNARSSFDALSDPDVRKLFDQELLDLLMKWEYTVITVCLDKRKHRETYLTWRYDPYHYCLAVLLEHFIYFLNRLGCRGDVMAESRGGKEDMRLKQSFERLYCQGTDYVGPDQFRKALTSGQLKVKGKSNNIAGLQIADLLAHPSRNEILREQGLLESRVSPFAEKVIEILGHKYDRREGIVFGKKFL